MIARIWHGYTTCTNAAVYESLLKNEVFPSIENKNVKGFRKISLLRRTLNDEVEFVTIMLFDDIPSIREFAGESYEMSYVPDEAKQLLQRYDERACHYEIIQEQTY